MAKSVPKKIGQCVYCAETKPVTKDHVIPKCLFPLPLPAVMVTVPACDNCNFEKSKHDDYLRDMLVVDADTAKSNGAQMLLSGKVMRSVKRNHSSLIRAARANGKYEPVYSRGGIYLWQGYSFPLEGERVNHIFSLIVRGLYSRTTGRLLPQDCELDVRRLTSAELAECWEHLQRISYNGPYQLGDNIFTCIFIYAAEEPAVSHWCMWFYDSVCVYVITQPSGFDMKPVTMAPK